MNKRPANQRLMQAVRTICARRSGFSVPAVALLGFGMVSVALAGPTGGIVVDGQATISTPTAGTTVIDQSSQHLQVNWNTFDVGASESVRFQQPSSSSVALNRILDQNPSQIFGRIDANGQVILVNPNGMLFGASAQLNVGSLVASSLDVIGFDAATGRYTFGTSRTDVGAIVNDGTISAARGGSVTLLGGRVTNNGSILADFGTVNLAAGRAATLDLAGDGLLRLEVDGELLSNNTGASAAVENGGVIEANGGQVLLTAQAVDDVFANLVNNTGVVRANRIDNSGGTIRLIGAGGTVRSSGVLDASAGDAVSSGGSVEMLGEQVGLFGSALVDVSGATSGGTALIGGDYQGKNPDVLNAARTYVSADSSIRADAGAVGDGGRVIVWADEITRFNGSISARGGALSGDGGFAEVSGKETLLFRGSANLSATNGFAGELLLDPRNIIVATGGVGDLDGATGDDSDVNTYAFAEDAADDITIAPDTITDILDTGTTVTLQAHNDITVTDAIDGSASTTPGGGLIFQAGDDIFINADVRTNDGAIQFTAGDDDATPTGADGDDAPTGELTLASGVTLAAGIADITLSSDGGMQLLGTVLGDAITLNSGGNMQLPGIVSGSAITAISGGTLTVGTLDAGATGSVNLTATGAILDDADNATRITGGTLTMNATAIGAVATNSEIDTAVSSLHAAATNGGVYIGESDGLTLTNVSAAGAGSDVSVTSATGNIVVDTVSATDTVTLTATAGAITDDGDDSTRISSANLTLTAGTAIGASSANGQIDTTVGSLTATADAGGVYIGEANGITLTNIDASGAGSDVSVVAGGDIVVGTVSAPDTVTLTAGGSSIIDDGNNATRIAGGTATLRAGIAIGTSGVNGQIDTDVTSLEAYAGLGDIYIGELNGLALNGVTAAGVGSEIVVTSETGDIVAGTVEAADAVTLTATAGSILDDTLNLTRISAQSLTLNAATAIGAGGANGQIDTTVASLSASAGAGSVYIGESDGFTLTNVSAAGAGNDVNVTSTTNDIIANNVTAANDVTLTATAGNLAVRTISAGDAVTLAAAGAIADDNNNATRISGGALTLTAGTSIGASGANGQIDTDVTSLTASAAAGSVYIGEQTGITLTNVSASGAGSNVNVRSETGSIVVGTVSAASAVTLSAVSGSISDDFINTTRIGAATASLSAGGAIGDSVVGGQIDTNVTSLSASAGSGGVYIGELNGLTLTSVTAGGVGNDVNVTSATGDIVANSVIGLGRVTLTAAAGDIEVASISAADAATLIATAGSIVDDGVDTTRIVAGTLALSAGTAIGGAATGAQIDTNVTSLSATAAGGGVHIGELNGLTLTNVSAGGTGSDVNVTSATGDIVAINVTAAHDVTLTGTSGNTTVANISAGNAVSLTAGAITDDGDNATRINADALTLIAGTAIGASGATGQIDTNVGSLTAVAGAGGVYIGEANGLTLTNVSAAVGDVDVRSTTGDIVANAVAATDSVTLTATAGDIEAGAINAGGAVTLTASAGAITDDDDDATVIAGSSVSLSAATNLGTVVDFAAADDADVGSSLDVQTNGALSASVTSNSGQINLNLSGTPTLAAGAITLGSGSNRSGAIVLQSSGNLNVAGLTAGAINIGSNNTTRLGLRSGGVLTLPSSGGFTDQAADYLLVRGATDVVDNDGTPREFSLAATTLDFRSGSAGGATILNTNVGQLSATVGNDQHLTVHETDGLILGTLDAGTGSIVLTAGGAVTDDGDDLTRIVGSTATLSAASLGTAGSALDTQVSALNATAASGGIYVREVDALALAASATGGAVDVSTASGSLTVGSASGDGVTLIAGGAGSAITLNGAVNAGTGDVTLTAGTAANRGAIIAGAGNQVIGGSLAATGSAIGAGGARLNTTVASLTATSSNGGIFITEADAVNLAANATGGAVDVETTNGALTVASAAGNAVTLTAGGAGSAITVNGAVNAGAGDVTLTAGTAASRGAIVAGAGNQVIGGALIATGSAIGTGAARLNTTVASLNATSTSGGIFVTETDALNVTASASGGAVDVRTTNGALSVASAVGDGVTLTAGGAGSGITVNGAVNAGAGDVTLTAGTAASRGAIVAGAGNQVIGGVLTATGSAIGTGGARLNTTVASLNATSTSGGIFVTESDALNLTANASGGAVDVGTTNGALTVAAASGDGVTLTAGGAGSGITVNGAVNAGADDVTLTAGTAASRGAIVAGAGNQVIGGVLTATGSAIGTGGARLNTTVASLNATSTSGGIFVTESDALNLTANASGGAVDVGTTNGALTVAAASGDGVTLAAGGAGNGLTLNGVVNAGAGNVTLIAGTAASRGAIVAGAGNQVIGGVLTATGSAIGTEAVHLNTTVASLNATSTNGGIFVTEADALNLTANASGGAVGVSTTNGALTVAAASGNGVTLTAGGAGNGITLNGAVNAGAGDVTLTAGTAASRGALVGAAGHAISGRTLTATAASIGSSAARLNTNVDALNAATAGDAYIAEQNGLTLANLSARNIDVTSAAGDIGVGTVAATGNVTLTANSGAITDDGDDTTRLSANALTLSARSIGAASTLSGGTLNSSGRLDTNVETLNATASAGGIFIDEADGLQNVNVQASGGAAGDIELLTRAGDLRLQHVNASDTLLLAAGRNIFTAAGAGPVTARVAELRAGTTDPTGGQIGTLADSIEFQLSAGNSLRLFVPQTIDPDDPNRAPATLPSAGVTSTLNLFASQNILATLAGFNQFQGLGETQFSSPAETLVRSLQNQTGTVQTGLDIDWGSFDPEVSLFGTLEPSVCLPADQRDEESSTPDC